MYPIWIKSIAIMFLERLSIAASDELCLGCAILADCYRCFRCDKWYCEMGCDSVHTCESCGLPRCHDYIAVPYTGECEVCQLSLGLGPHLLAQTRHCGAFVNMPAHVCEVCRRPQCIADRCRSHIATNECCRKDVCGDCTVVYKGRRWCRTCPLPSTVCSDRILP